MRSSSPWSIFSLFCRQKSSLEHSAACKLQVSSWCFKIFNLSSLSDLEVSSETPFPQRGTTARQATKTSLRRQSDKRSCSQRVLQEDPMPSHSLTPFQNSQTARHSPKLTGTRSQQQQTISAASSMRSRRGTSRCSLEKKNQRSRQHSGQLRGRQRWALRRGGRNSIWKLSRSCSNYKGYSIFSNIWHLF